MGTVVSPKPWFGEVCTGGGEDGIGDCGGEGK